MASIKITTGIKTYDIEDENGNIRGQIKFNPSDVNFYPRAKVAVENILKHIEKVNSLNPDTDIDIASVIEQSDKTIKDEINKLFTDENTSDIVFGQQNCLNLLNGVTFIERFLDVMLPIIKEESEKMAKESESRISKYTEMLSD